jgi:hypothetical protein
MSQLKTEHPATLFTKAFSKKHRRHVFNREARYSIVRRPAQATSAVRKCPIPKSNILVVRQ